jgi:uncharacterized repeat protein (TIGR01451 family)
VPWLSDAIDAAGGNLMKKFFSVMLCTLMMIGSGGVNASVLAEDQTSTVSTDTVSDTASGASASSNSAASADSSSNRSNDAALTINADDSTNTISSDTASSSSDNTLSTDTKDTSASMDSSANTSSDASAADSSTITADASADTKKASSAADIIASDNSTDYTIQADAAVAVTGVFLYTPVTESELVADIQAGQSVVAFIGNVTDNDFEQLLEAYHSVYVNLDDEDKADFMQLDTSSITDSSTEKLLGLTTMPSYQKSIQTALDGAADGTHDTGTVIFSYNKYIRSLYSLTEGKTDQYTWTDAAVHDFAAGHQKAPFPVVKTVKSSRMLMGVSEIDPNEYPTYVEKHEEYFGSSDEIQRFTAKVAGTYKIEIWGASGDSDLGFYRGKHANSDKPTTGFGGGGGYTYGEVHLDYLQTIYLALGPRNGFSQERKYNGGGAGAGLEADYLAGGGGAASVYWDMVGNGNLYEYIKSDGTPDTDKIIMVAGGGGGGEDFFDPWTKGEIIYPCSAHACATSMGGNGGNNPTKGTSQANADGDPASYKFGLGQSYAGAKNASSGGGGAGWIGGSSYPGSLLEGGTGGGGSSWINTTATGDKAVSNYGMSTGETTSITWTSETTSVDNGYDSHAKITLEQIDQYTLTINYLDKKNDNKPLEGVASRSEKIKFGTDYTFDDPVVSGYKPVSVTNVTTSKSYDITTEDQKTIKGTMPAHDVTINVYYDYSTLTINYLNYDTGAVVATKYSENMKTDTPYSITSPDVENMVRYDDTQDVVAGTKKDTDEVYNVYYVPAMAPHKDIIDVNGHAVTKAESDAGVDLKKGDIVTYSISYENYRGVAVDLPITDTLASYLEYQDGSGNPTPTVSADLKTLTWDINVPARDAAQGSVSAGAVTFKAKVTDDSTDTVDNWTRKDPVVKYTVTKSAEPASGTYVAYNQEITYHIFVKNTGNTTLHNLVVLDKIPDNTELVTVEHAYNGVYVTDGNYVKYVITYLPKGNSAILTFKVKVTKQVTDNSTTEIDNSARYENVADLSETDLDTKILATGNKTNIVKHYVQGPVISTEKTAVPASGSVVNAGDAITYSVKLTNTGTVKSNFIRTTDDIPAGTTYVANSLKIVNENEDSNSKYAFISGTNFDIRYNFTTSRYQIENAGITLTEDANLVTVTWPAGLTLASDSAPSGWTKSAASTATSQIYDVASNGDAASVNAYFDSVRLAGAFGADGTITVKAEKKVFSSTSNNLTATINADNTVSLSGASFPTVTRTINWFELDWPSGLTLTTQSAPSGWTMTSQTDSSIKYSTASNNAASNLVAYLDALKFSGTLANGTFAVHVAENPATTSWSYGSDGSFTAPFAGTFRLEAWGAQGGHSWEGNWGGWGGYAAGNYTMTAGQTIYVTVGGSGWPNMGKRGGTYNGGGQNTSEGAQGGGATDWTTTHRGVLSVYESYQGEVLVVGGGGGAGGNGGSGGTGGNYHFGQGDDGTQYGGGGGWYGGTARVGGTSHVNSALTNQSMVAGANGNNVAYGASGGKAAVTAVSYTVTESASSSAAITSSYSGSTASAAMPSYSNNLGCKYVTTNGDPYVECITSDLNVGQSATMSFAVTVNNPIPDGQKKVLNTAKFETLWTDPGNAGTITTKPTSTTNTTVHPLLGAPVITAIKSSTPATTNDAATATRVTLGSKIDYTIHVANTGEGPADYVVVRDAIPAHTYYVQGSASDGGVYVEGQYVEWVLKDMNVGDTKDITFSVTVDKNAMGNDEIDNVALYQAYQEDPGEPGAVTAIPGNETNKTVHVVPAVIAGEPAVNISVVKSADPAEETPIARNSDVTYNLHIANTGAGVVKYIVLRDYIPDGTTYKETLAYTGGTLSTDTTVETAYVAGTKPYVEWKISQLALADTIDLKFKVTVDKETLLTEIVNSALYSIITAKDPGKPGEITTEPVTPTNIIKHPLINPSVTVVKSADPISGSMVKHGSTIRYILTATNNGTVNDNYIAITDAIPQYTTYVAGSASVKTGDSAALSADGTMVQFLLKDLPAGESREVSFEVTVNKDVQQGGVIYNHALFETTIQNPGTPGDPAFPTIPEDNDHITNTTEHHVEFMNSSLQTGGEGWNRAAGSAAGIISLIAVLALLHRRKR